MYAMGLYHLIFKKPHLLGEHINLEAALVFP